MPKLTDTPTHMKGHSMPAVVRENMTGIEALQNLAEGLF